MTAEEWRTTVDAYVDECIGLRTPPRATELAARMGISAVRLTRRLRTNLGVHPSRYIKERQVAHAKELLAGDATLDEIAIAAGFGTARTFFRAFSRFTGTTPAAWRSLQRNGQNVKKMSVASPEVYN
jgi:AraC-like DNA-binding protein